MGTFLLIALPLYLIGCVCFGEYKKRKNKRSCSEMDKERFSDPLKEMSEEDIIQLKYKNMFESIRKDADLRLKVIELKRLSARGLIVLDHYNPNPEHVINYQTLIKDMSYLKLILDNYPVSRDKSFNRMNWKLDYEQFNYLYNDGKLRNINVAKDALKNYYRNSPEYTYSKMGQFPVGLISTLIMMLPVIICLIMAISETWGYKSGLENFAVTLLEFFCRLFFGIWFMPLSIGAGIAFMCIMSHIKDDVVPAEHFDFDSSPKEITVTDIVNLGLAAHSATGLLSKAKEGGWVHQD